VAKRTILQRHSVHLSELLFLQFERIIGMIFTCKNSVLHFGHRKSHEPRVLRTTCKTDLFGVRTLATYAMRCSVPRTRWLYDIANVPVRFGKSIALFQFPCFKASHFFFKLAYALNQRRRSVVRRGFLFEFYDRPARVATSCASCNLLISIMVLMR